GISPPLADVLARSLEKEPANRYRNAGQMAHALRGQWAEMAHERAATARPAGRERIIVPAPPAQLDEVLAPVRQAFLVPEEEEKEPAMLNCLTVLLLILAIVAVLGLIPLWRTLYRRYTAPPALPTPSSESRLEPDGLHGGDGLQAGSEGAGVLFWEAEPAILPGGSRSVLTVPARARSALAADPAPLRSSASVPLQAPNWSLGLFSDIMRCCPGICRAIWSQYYGFFRRLGLL
ncbi:MAG TPA: hypothetical protein VLC52_03025, partial [Anaerolineae bacterium]|nr:hypothetical protein [Anaerolineae bacterium]